MHHVGDRTFTEWLWSEIEATYAAILEHPFLRGIASGDLPIPCFQYYTLQDALYLQSFAKALNTLAGRAPTADDGAFLAARSCRVVEIERALHESLLRELEVDEATVSAAEPSPTTLAYTSYILATVWSGSFVDGLASVLPCFWIYREVGEALAAEGSPHPLFQRWIDAYDDAEYAQAVGTVLSITDRLGPQLASDDAERARRHFVRASRYEWMFWDAAWRQEAWPAAARASALTGSSAAP
jgi:thiaminase/transcriptional activator TenA